MSIIKVIYQEEPTWPPTDNHPEAQRFEIQRAGETLFADCIGGAPTQAEVDAFFAAA